MINIESMDADELLLLLKDNQRHSIIPDEDLEAFMYFGLSIYGGTDQEYLIPHLISLYSELVARLPIESRTNLNRSITDKIDKKELSANALLPFIGFEPAHHIVSTAVIDYCMFRETKYKALEGVGDVIGILRSGTALCQGGIVGGLLLLGDQRVNDLLAELPYLTREEDISTVATTFSGFLYAPMIEFYLDWMVYLNNSKTEAEFGSLASGLVNMIRRDNYGVVSSLERSYGRPNSKSSVRTVFQKSFGDYFNEIEAKMLRIADAETKPKIMPTVINLWREHQQNLEDNS